MSLKEMRDGTCSRTAKDSDGPSQSGSVAGVSWSLLFELQREENAVELEKSEGRHFPWTLYSR